MGHEASAGSGTVWGTEDRGQRFPALARDELADVVVVGAGIAGLSVARELARAGRKVAVLESHVVGAGVTGHTTAKVSVLQGARLAALGRRHGEQTAAAFVESQTAAMLHVADVVRRLGVDCDLEERPAYLFSEDVEDLTTLHDEAAAARRLGLPARFTHDTGLPFPTVGGVQVEDQLQFHPLRYLDALTDDLLAHGGRIWEGTTVTGLEERGRPAVRTADGHRVRAEHAVVATHFPLFDRSLLFARMHTSREFAVAGPVAERDAPHGMYISAGSDTRSLRTAPHDGGGRLLIATGAPFTPGEADARARLDDLVDWFTSHTAVERVEHVWAAQDNFTPDGLPFIGPLHPRTSRVWVATGFGGWGMTNGALAGTLLRDHIEGHPPPWADVYHPRRLKLAPEAQSATRAALRTVRGWAGARIAARVRDVDDVTAVRPGEAAVVSDKGGTWATHRDEDGTLHCVSAVCTHMGCLVAFNDVERTWECPCHGSRFGVDGQVLQGPATAPLQPRPGD